MGRQPKLKDPILGLTGAASEYLESFIPEYIAHEGKKKAYAEAITEKIYLHFKLNKRLGPVPSEAAKQWERKELKEKEKAKKAKAMKKRMKKNKNKAKKNIKMKAIVHQDSDNEAVDPVVNTSNVASSSDDSDTDVTTEDEGDEQDCDGEGVSVTSTSYGTLEAKIVRWFYNHKNNNKIIKDHHATPKPRTPAAAPNGSLLSFAPLVKIPARSMYATAHCEDINREVAARIKAGNLDTTHNFRLWNFIVSERWEAMDENGRTYWHQRAREAEEAKNSEEGRLAHIYSNQHALLPTLEALLTTLPGQGVNQIGEAVFHIQCAYIGEDKDMRTFSFAVGTPEVPELCEHAPRYQETISSPFIAWAKHCLKGLPPETPNEPQNVTVDSEQEKTRTVGQVLLLAQVPLMSVGEEDVEKSSSPVCTPSPLRLGLLSDTTTIDNISHVSSDQFRFRSPDQGPPPTFITPTGQAARTTHASPAASVGLAQPAIDPGTMIAIAKAAIELSATSRDHAASSADSESAAITPEQPRGEAPTWVEEIEPPVVKQRRKRARSASLPPGIDLNGGKGQRTKKVTAKAQGMGWPAHQAAKTAQLDAGEQASKRHCIDEEAVAVGVRAAEQVRQPVTQEIRSETEGCQKSRGRGRPRKPKHDHSVHGELGVVQVQVKPKKRRGRPPKAKTGDPVNNEGGPALGSRQV
ncbi:hypothetical protein M422DRAFT_275503 [Sphaerobolus stellatus SS14]|uniref:Uncharacterized protein n=1 Tax=Sphaerobolus stellatus (strain SS14) TaxID=990650 RepID=A0A0C9UF73_SPHS4|nr:hypothetical protein M422DRAFT_275503 [Sphaerobolus stellatus SS14]